jgi:hypothetical protein
LFIPAALAIYGIVLLDHTARRDPFTASSAVLLSLSAVASLSFGVFRGRTVELFIATGSSGSGRRGPISASAGAGCSSSAWVLSARLRLLAPRWPRHRPRSH